MKRDEYGKEQLVSEALKKEIQFAENRHKTELGVLRKVLVHVSSGLRKLI